MIEIDAKDRRRAARLDFVSEVIVRSEKGDRTIKGELINLSIGGMSLRTPLLLDKGSKCISAILINDRYSQLIIKDVHGEVVRSAEEEIAIKFSHRFEWLALFHVYRSKSVQEEK